MDTLGNMTAFVKVVDCKGFSAAASRLKITPAMVSKHIRILEETLGARLLNRTTRKIGLTDIGKRYYERCQQILSEIDEANRIASAEQTTPRGIVRLNSANAISPYLAKPVAEFVERYPECSVVQMVTDRMMDMVEEGYDVAIRTTPVRDSSLIVRKLSTYYFVVVGSPDYLKRKGTPKTPADLTQHNCLIYSASPWGNEWPFQGAKGIERVPVHGSLQTNSPSTMRTAALNGLGLVYAPSFIAEEDIAAGLVVPVLKKYLPEESDISAYYPHRQLLSAKVRALLDVFAEHFSKRKPD